MQMTLVQLEYFLHVAETGSFRKTAEIMYVSQPAVSKQIALLEQEWNLQLFDRSYRMAILTEAGRYMYRKITTFRDEFAACLKDARVLDKWVATEIRVGILERVNMQNLLEIFSEFQQEHPEVLLTVEQVPLDKLKIDSPDSRYDMVISHDSAFSNNNALEIHEIMRTRRRIILSCKNSALKGNVLRLSDLNRQRFFIPGTETETASLKWFIRFCSSHKLKDSDYIVVPNLDSVIMSVQLNFGVGIVDETVKLPEDGSVVAVPFGDSFGIALVWHKGHNNPAIPLMADKILSNPHLRVITESADKIELLMDI